VDVVLNNAGVNMVGPRRGHPGIHVGGIFSNFGKAGSRWSHA
jgi:hypothetical protein